MLPSRYPLGDAGLQLVYDVIGVLTTVHRWAFSTRGWHLRLQAPAAPAPPMGLDYGADLPGAQCASYSAAGNMVANHFSVCIVSRVTFACTFCRIRVAAGRQRHAGRAWHWL